MAKIDFSNSRYARFFSSKENKNLLQTLLDTTDLLDANYMWWKSQCEIDPNYIPVNPDGTASFTQYAKSLETAHMADMRAPLSDALQEDTKGFEFYTGSIPDFTSTAIKETAMERKHKEDIFDMFGNDTEIVKAWLQSTQRQVDSIHQTANNLVAQLMTTGKQVYNFGRGIHSFISKAEIPAQNFKKAGVKVWTASDCNILTVMAEAEQRYRDETGYDGSLVWQMTKRFFHNVFLKNAEVKELVMSWRKMNWIADMGDIPVTKADWEKAYTDITGNISPIELVVEKERNLTDSGNEIIYGWGDKYVVLRPALTPCTIKKCRPIDLDVFKPRFMNDAIDMVFGQVGDGICTIVNSTHPDGNFKSWSTHTIAKFVPALNHFTHHYIFDTSTVG